MCIERKMSSDARYGIIDSPTLTSAQFVNSILHAGKAAHSGVLAAELAALGFTGPTQIYETADGGFLKAFSDKSNAAPLTHELGKFYHLDAVSIKPYSCCGSTHAYIDAALQLRSRLGSRWDASRPVQVGMSKVVDVQCGFDYKPSSALNAQMSLRYCLAAALNDGQVLPAQFSEAKMHDPALGKLAAHLELVDDPALDKLYPAHFAGWVAAKNGNDWMRVDILDPTGSLAAPMDAAAVSRKVAGHNPQLAVEKIAAVALNMEKHTVRELIDLLMPTVAAQVAAAKPDFFWVGLSTPKQEKFMAAYSGKLDAKILLGVGAAFDFHAGRVKQAPRWIQRSGFEWLYRTCKEPRRLWKRYTRYNPRFVIGFARQYARHRFGRSS